MLTVWPATDHAVVIAVGRHDELAQDVYAALLDALELDVPPTSARSLRAATATAYLPLTRRRDDDRRGGRAPYALAATSPLTSTGRVEIR
jgi:Flp pilus assembly protein CpaB